ncbi:MAG: prepilin-type N-terminal cleavage/methylation domain-containing protein [Solidesulfovibrio sp. DCME]|uniref:prepilin-type N-terminal cleavage/methylation domain-containing protein n=1 Tax=Solidesulfovibrio sp. DCME TaxID=3447380 RepID=UPI003D0FA206
MTHGRREAGFTLVEVLLAVLLAGLVMVGSYSVASQVMRLSEEAGIRLEVESAKAILRLALADDLGSVIYVEGGKSQSANAMVFLGGQAASEQAASSPAALGPAGTADRRLLSLASAASLDPGQPFPSHGFNRVEYVLRAKEASQSEPAHTSLLRRERIAATVTRRQGQEEPVNETVLAARIEDTAITFYGRSADDASSTWDSPSRERDRLRPLPAQVRLTGTLVVAGKRFPVDVRVALPARLIEAAGRS